MDLFAYLQIDKYRGEIEDILTYIPRLRGIRKMSEEDPRDDICYQIERFNNYCGQEGVYMIHARVGGDNWDYYDGEEKIATQPWFLEKVDDDFDNTYCDIYVRKGKGKNHG